MLQIATLWRNHTFLADPHRGSAALTCMHFFVIENTDQALILSQETTKVSLHSHRQKSQHNFASKAFAPNWGKQGK